MGALRFTCASACLILIACGPGGDGAGAGADAAVAFGLEIEPADAELVVRDGALAEQAYTATAVYGDGTRADVTSEVSFAIEDVRLGSFSSEVFTASGVSGGRALVRGVHSGGAAGEAVLTVRVEGSRVEDGAPQDAADLFDAATEDPARAPSIVYPSDETMVPPNLGDFETHWTDPADSDLYEVRLHGEFVDLRVYVTGNPGAGSWTAFLPEEWSIAGGSERGAELTVTVRGLSTADPGAAGTSAPIAVELTDQDVEGGIYYWASSGGSPSGIYRHDMSRPGEPAEAFYTTEQTPENRCVACHFLSRDGTRMAVTYDGGNGAASVLDVASQTPMLPTDGTFKWNFAAFEPGGDRLLTVAQGVMTLRDASSGAALSTVDADGWVTQPDFSPQGDRIVYVSTPAPSNDWTFTDGSVVTREFDAGAGTFGPPATLVPADGANTFYPTFSPDGRWILYNRSTENAYDDPDAEIWVVPANGSSDPVELATPNLAGGLTNSWGRWAPFEQTLSSAVGQEETFFWYTFSSKRAFGVRLAEGQPQIWMAPFFPERLAAGEEPSAPAFRLPFQKLDTNNHIAQWTEQIIPVD